MKILGPICIFPRYYNLFMSGACKYFDSLVYSSNFQFKNSWSTNQATLQTSTNHSSADQILHAYYTSILHKSQPHFPVIYTPKLFSPIQRINFSNLRKRIILSWLSRLCLWELKINHLFKDRYEKISNLHASRRII